MAHGIAGFDFVNKHLSAVFCLNISKPLIWIDHFSSQAFTYVQA